MNGLEEPSNRIFVKKKTWNSGSTKGEGLPIPSFYHFFPKLNLPWNRGLYFFAKIHFFSIRALIWDLEFF